MRVARGWLWWPSALLLAVAAAGVLGSGAWLQAEEPGRQPAVEEPGKQAQAEAPAKAPQPQEGLPAALRIDPGNLDEQERTLTTLVGYAQVHEPPSGLLASVKRWFAGTREPPLRPLRAVVEGAGLYEGNQIIALEGFCEERGGRIVFDNGADVVEIRIDPKATTTVEGFPHGKYVKQPAIAQGMISRGGEGAVLIASKLTPATVLTRVRLGRVRELQGDWKGAVESYTKVLGKGGPTSSSEWAPFAICRAAHLTQTKLRDQEKSLKQTMNLYNAAWMAYSNPTTPGGPLPSTWVLTRTDEGEVWLRQSVRQAIAEPLDALNRDGFWYKFVHLFTVVCGGQAWLGLVSIAVFTRLLLYPLSTKQLKSAKEMRRLQPEVKAIQEKYKGDRQKQQEAIMKLYRSHKVNIFGGCLPLLVQLPFFWMVYSGIRAYIVPLSEQSFLWVRDLSAPDPPLLVIYLASMVLFQWVANKAQPAMDDQQQQQQKMMLWMMPLMMWFILGRMNLPSGFILYWLGSNLIYIPTQILGMRQKAKEGEPMTLEPRQQPAASNPGAVSKDQQANGSRRTFEQKRRQEGARKRSPTKRKRRRRV